jgi:ribonuclease PH
VVNLERLGERTVWIDCDVIQADGGTRTASITGSFIALAIALENLRREGVIEENVILDQVAAVSVGICEDTPLLDLDYSEDSNAEVDMNIVMTGSGDFVEVQGTAEGVPFSNDQLTELLGLADKGIRELIQVQKTTLNEKFDGNFQIKETPSNE